MCAERPPNPRAFIDNWRSSDDRTLVKLAQLIRNNAKKALTLSTCCGNDGEPGC